jgi:hypothetical protein
VVAPHIEGATQLQDTENADEPFAHAVAAGDIARQLLLTVARAHRVRGVEIEKGPPRVGREALGVCLELSRLGLGVHADILEHHAAVRQEYTEGPWIAQLEVPAKQDPIGKGQLAEQFTLVDLFEGGRLFHGRDAWAMSRSVVQSSTPPKEPLARQRPGWVAGVEPALSSFQALEAAIRFLLASCRFTA